MVSVFVVVIELFDGLECGKCVIILFGVVIIEFFDGLECGNVVGYIDGY